MSKTLGLDIGTNSIGWCLVEDTKQIIDLGVRIFPVGVKEDDYNKSGSEISKNATRRGARGIRRLYDRYKIRRKQLRKILLDLGMLPEDNSILMSAELYGLRKKALDEKLSLQELGRIFLLLNQRRGFKSSKKDAKTVEAAKERSEIKKQMNELEQKVKDSGCRTVGEYFYHLFTQNKKESNWRNPDEPTERIRTRFVYRRMFEQEFDMIWDKQKQFYPKILTGSKEEYDGIKKNTELSFAERAEKSKDFRKTNHYKIKNACIFYQRPLKSQKHLIGHCRFEPSKRVCPKSSFEFQEFRIWQTVSNIRVTHALRYRDKLSLTERTTLANELNKSDSLSLSKIKKLLNLSVKTAFNDIPDKIRGNYTNAKLADALGVEFWESLPNYRPEDCQKEHPNYYQNKYTIWHTLFFANDEEWLNEYAAHKLGLSEEQIKKYVDVNLEQDYSNISTKAIRPILAYMKEDHDYAEACEYAGYHHSYDEEKDSADRILEDKIVRKKDDNLRNPLVNQAVSETIRLVNAVMKEHGRPDIIRVEFARSLKKPKDVREKMKRNNDEKERKRDSYRAFLKEKLGKVSITKSDILKYELWLEMGCEENDIPGFKEFAAKVNTKDEQKYCLWLECNRISPYTSEPISLTKLFTPEIEIEHIVPYSKCMDDSFANKTLSEREFNEKKGNQTPYDYFKGNVAEWEKFKLRIRDFSDSKQQKFTMEEIPQDFLNSQLNNTAYIAIEARKQLKKVCKNVRITNGQATSHLRRFWGLNDILNVDRLNEKSRHDHRHHAIDALVIANTTEHYINLLSQQSQFDYTGKMILKDVKFPYPEFKLEATDKLHKIFISYRNKKRLITTKRNKYIHSKSKNHRNEDFKGIQSVSARGGLHKEYCYGAIEYPHRKSNKYDAGVTYNVIRRKISEIEDAKQLEKVIDPKVREVLQERLDAFEGSFKKAFADDPENPIYMYSEKEKKIPMKRVRMIFDKVSIDNMIHLPPIKGVRDNERLYVNPGDNYMIAVYGDITPKSGIKSNRDYDTITFFSAVQRACKNEPIFQKDKEGKGFLFSLIQRDMVVVFKEHPDEIEWDNTNDLFNRMYRVMQFDTNGIIILGKHNLSKINAVRDQKPDVIRCNSNTIRAVKVKITATGKLLREH